MIKVIEMSIVDVMGMHREQWDDFFAESEFPIIASKFNKFDVINIVIPSPIDKIWTFMPNFNFSYNLAVERGEDLDLIRGDIKKEINRKINSGDNRKFKNGLLDLISFTNYAAVPYGKFIAIMAPCKKIDELLRWIAKNIQYLIKFSCSENLSAKLFSRNNFSFSSAGFFDSRGLVVPVWNFFGVHEGEAKYYRRPYVDLIFDIHHMLPNIKRCLADLEKMDFYFSDYGMEAFLAKYSHSICEFNLPLYKDGFGELPIIMMEKRVDMLSKLKFPHFYDSIFTRRDVGLNVLEQFDFLLKNSKNNDHSKRILSAKQRVLSIGDEMKGCYGDLVGFEL